MQPFPTTGGGRRKAVLAGLALCTHILAQSDPQVRTSAPLPRHTKLSQNSQQSGKPKRKFSSSWAHHQLSGRTAYSCSGQRRRCTSHGSLPLFWCGASSSCSHYMLTSCSTSSVKSRRHNYRPRLPGILSCEAISFASKPHSSASSCSYESSSTQSHRARSSCGTRGRPE